ncbi:MAG: amidase [Chloroflexota bacterium]|nr:amidase [Chloroflexota bacterium]
MTEALRRMTEGTLTAAQLMASVLDRMNAIPEDKHPYVAIRDRETLLAEAAKVDEARKAGHAVGPLAGIPLGIKDIVDVAGIPTKCGSRSMADVVPAAEDAPLVCRWKEAGAIVVGKTVTQEFAAGTISAPSRNPWDLDRIPGGSSGGSAAAVAAGMALLTIGTDTGGSIRCPASLCGVTGLKPTYGSVSRRGVFPLAWTLDTCGPIARTVEDCATALDLISGHDPLDPGSAPVRHEPATEELGQDIRGLRIGVPRGFFRQTLEAELDGIFDTAAQRLGSLGAEIVEADWNLAHEARLVAMLINRVETSAVHEGRVRTQQALIGEEWGYRLKAGLLFPAVGYARAHQARIVIRQSIANYFNAHNLDAMIAPGTAGVAARADDPYLRYTNGTEEHVLTAYTRMTMPINATGQPVVTVPVGFNSAGLPIGMQIVGRPFAEARICRIGHAYEAAARWVDRRPPLGGDR